MDRNNRYAAPGHDKSVGGAGYAGVVSPRKQRKQGSAGSESPPSVPRFTLKQLQPMYEQVQQLRRENRLLSEQEKDLRNHLTHLIKYLTWASRTAYDQQTGADLRRARQMQDKLNGISRPKNRVDPQVIRDWDETRDRSTPAPRRALPRGGIRQVVTGGSPGLGKRK